MKRIKFKKIDAFAKGLAAGNPAGVIYLENQELTDTEMLTIAMQLKGFVSEVVYLTPVQGDREEIYSLRYFSSECEVEFCGHGTIACMYDYIKNKTDLLKSKKITIRTEKKGELSVYNEIKENDAVFITAPKPEFLEMKIPIEKISSSLKIMPETIDITKDIAFIDAGLRTLIIPIKDFNEIIKIRPEIIDLRDFCIKNNLDIILVYCHQTFWDINSYRTRVFAPKYGYLEDPATGSGNAAFGYHLLQRRIWDGKQISIEQGPNLDNPNIVKLSTIDSGGLQQVIVGGNATVRIEGTYLLY